LFYSLLFEGGVLVVGDASLLLWYDIMGTEKKRFSKAMELHLPAAGSWRLNGCVECRICGAVVEKGRRHRLVTDGNYTHCVVYEENGLERAKKIAEGKDCSIIVEKTFGRDK
jgi:hypothetical protein